MIQRILSGLLAVLFIVLVFVLTSFLVALALTAGLLGYGWLWWRARRQRRRVIEGEYRIIESR